MKLISLSQGLFAKVDDEWFDRLSVYKWSAHKDGRTFYALHHFPRRDGSGRRDTVKMQNFIMEEELEKLPKGMTVDHIDHDGLNNQTSNLRPATKKEQAHNRQMFVNNTSGFRGVTWVKSKNKWQAAMNSTKKSIFLGLYTNREDAAHAHDSKARELYGKFAYLNFPDDP